MHTVRIIGLLFPPACFLLLPSLKAGPCWKCLDIYTRVTGVTFLVMIVSWIGEISTGWLSARAGLYERIFVENAVIWLEVTAVRLLLLPSCPERLAAEKGERVK